MGATPAFDGKPTDREVVETWLTKAPRFRLAPLTLPACGFGVEGVVAVISLHRYTIDE